MTPNHSGGSATLARLLATSSDSSAVAVLGCPSGRSAASSGICRAEFGEHPVTFECQVAARRRGPCPQSLHQSRIKAARAEKCGLDQHLAALLLDGTAGRDEDELAVRVRRLAGRRLGDIDGPAGDVGGEEPEPVRIFRRQRRSRLGQDGIDEFIEGADDIGIVGEHLDDGRVDGTAQVQPLGREAACEDQHAGGGHFAQR